MDDFLRSQVRQTTRQSRRGPGEEREIRVSFDSEGIVGNDLSRPPQLLTIEATDEDGQLATWFDDIWWTDVLQIWGDAAITIQIAPTFGALIHPVVLHQIEMVRRVGTNWRSVGFGWVNDARTEHHVRALACSGYDELRVIDALRTGLSGDEARCPWSTAAELIGAIRFEQVRIGANRPVLARIAASSAPNLQPSKSKPLHRVTNS